MDLQELREIREKAQKETNVRKSEAEKKVTVCMGTCGIAAGARPVLNAFVEEVNKAGLEDVMVTQTGCVGLCSKEPVAEVETPAGDVTYGDLTPERVRRIVQEHLAEGTVVSDYVITEEAQEE